MLINIGISTIVKDFSSIEESNNLDRGVILGAAYSNGDDLAIFYKASDSINRQKFTIAHELGHCCLHCPTEEASHIEYRLTETHHLSAEQKYKELQANIFAGELLIPTVTLHNIYNQMLNPSLKELSIIFRVSTSVMAERLSYLKFPYFNNVEIENNN